jgi:hypothetical protein
MMRRTMKTTIMNRPIIVLPPPHPEIQYVEFSKEEQIIYRITENRFRTNINKYFADKNDPGSNYTIFLVQLLRLRQCTSHPFMMERTIREAWTSEDVHELHTRLLRLKKDNTPFYEKCKLWVSQSEEERRKAKEARERHEEAPPSLEAMPFGKSKFGHKFRLDKALVSLSSKKQQEMYGRVVCSLCSDIPQDPLSTDVSYYIFKRHAQY